MRLLWQRGVWRVNPTRKADRYFDQGPSVFHGGASQKLCRLKGPITLSSYQTPQIGESTALAGVRG